MSARIRFTAIKAPEKQIATAAAIVELEAAAHDWGSRMIRRLQSNYDHVPPSITYKRTGKLREGWYKYQSRVAGNLSVVVINKASNTRGREYATFVQGRRRRLFHRARGWKTAEEVSKELEGALPFHAIVGKIFRKHVGV